MRLHRPALLSGSARVSVVVPCYRYGRYLGGAVESALDQPGLDVDVLIVDDASPDDSAEIAQSIAANDPRVRVLINKTNQRHIATYNRGIAHVTGEFVVVLSADDLLVPGSVTRAVALMKAHPSVGFVYGCAPRFRGAAPRPRRGPVLWATWSGHEWLGRQCRRGSNVIMSPEVVMRRAVLTELGAYDPEMPHAADMELWLRAALHWDVGRVIGPDQAFYRQHDANMHVDTFGGVVDDLIARRQVSDKVLDEEALGLIPDVGRQRLHQLSRRALALEAVETAIYAVDRGLPGGRERAKVCLDFASETWPDIRNSRLWRATETPAGTTRSSFRSRGTAVLRRVRHSGRWRLRWYLGV